LANFIHPLGFEAVSEPLYSFHEISLRQQSVSTPAILKVGDMHRARA
jgi:hypothetical protein